nr:uncharacterized protein CI109_006804 [Kwoniella shandongensis]KAA5524854.1 hypothetical protein CI109_006804 [Kwoniella shandongensis]
MSSSYTYTIRDALSSEDDEIALLFYNNFLKTWNHNWWASAKVPPPPLEPTSKPNSQLRFKRALVKGVRLSKGHRIRVIIVHPNPNTNDINGLTSTPPRPLSASRGKDGHDDDGGVIVGAAMWFPPNVRYPTDPVSLYKTGMLGITPKWGIKGYKRLEIDWEPALHRLAKEGFKSHVGTGKEKTKPDDSIFLQMIAVDHAYRGKGLGSKLLRDGEQLYNGVAPAGSPILLEATEKGPRDVYLKHGYEIIGETKLGKGSCDEDGCTGQGKKMMKQGGDVWVMCKWR